MKNIFLPSICLLFSSGVVADQVSLTVESLLEKMHTAAHMQNFTGTFVYGQGSQISSMRIVHGVDARGEHERLISLDGSGREVIRSGNNVTCILPDSNSVIVEKSRPDQQFPPAFPIKIAALHQHYHFQIAGSGSVAGQQAHKIMIEPRDAYRYGHHLWIDAKTGLLLKTHLVDMQGSPVEQFMFTDIQYPDSIPESMLKPDLNSNKYKWYRAEESETSRDEPKPDTGWKVGSLPPGFQQDMQRMHAMGKGRMPVEHMVFTDGLASVSVFIEKQMDVEDKLVGASHMGAVNAYGRSIGDYHVTVVGEVPLASVKLIAESVKYLSND